MDRVSLHTLAIEKSPTVMAGIIIWAKVPRPDVGSHFNFTENISIIISPNQKDGIACPQIAIIRTTESTTLPFFVAAIIPSGIPITIATNIPANVSCIVAGSRFIINDNVDCL